MVSDSSLAGASMQIPCHNNQVIAPGKKFPVAELAGSLITSKLQGSSLTRSANWLLVVDSAFYITTRGFLLEFSPAFR